MKSIFSLSLKVWELGKMMIDILVWKLVGEDWRVVSILFLSLKVNKNKIRNKIIKIKNLKF